VEKLKGTDYKRCFCQSPAPTHEAAHCVSNRSLLNRGKNALWRREKM